LPKRSRSTKKKAKLESVLQEIRKQSGYDIYYDSKDISSDLEISVQVNNVDIIEALNSTFKNLPLTFDRSNIVRVDIRKRIIFHCC